MCRARACWTWRTPEASSRVNPTRDQQATGVPNQQILRHFHVFRQDPSPRRVAPEPGEGHKSDADYSASVIGWMLKRCGASTTNDLVTCITFAHLLRAGPRAS